MPRLEHWTAKYPDIDIRISASLGLANFGPDGVDLAVRFGGGRYDGLTSTLLLEESFAVVCSPIFVDGTNQIKSPEDLRNHALIHVTGGQSAPGTEWQEWLQTVGVEGVDTTRGLSFDDSSVAILAAIGGQGTLLSRRALVENDIAAGRLALPFELDLPTDFAWHIVALEEKLNRPEVAAFRDWLLSEVQNIEN